MRYTFDIYRRLISVNIRSQLQYRVSFIFDVMATALITALSFGTVVLVLQRFNNIAGWTVYEIAFLFGMAELGFGTMDMIFSGFDPPYFGHKVRYGGFDQLLLRPVNLITQVLGSQFILRRLGRIIQGTILVVISLINVQIHWTPLKVLMIPMVYISLILFFGGMFIIGATLSFWTIESIEAVNIFTYGGTEMMEYPMDIYPNFIRTFFTYVLPAIFILYYPAIYILDKPDPFSMPVWSPFIAPFVAVAVLFVGMIFWNYGLRFYQSTGT